ncbi:UTP--glucose-1-phosphate uridylyltransferase [Marivita sp. S6314]|uniref:UTP--glucose-1-phosphate uridylyltransferase n=1 Tax=Marivita sp. S6314 TaxID=2926406 RepID=UPI001FF5D64A|nr:UTP--glucose-1-phosphate uridylyltransferase [Marivita sp. S6314]MCK0149485.1 UTP--glucose-1-phosphate uridylyltransferase [Marivita sp. S6314]
MKPVRKAVFPVAGLGTRFLPATKSVPKEMLPLVDRPLIQYAVDEARAAGIEEFIFVTSPGKSALENYFGALPALERTLEEKGKDDILSALRGSKLPEASYSFVRQDEARGLGHAVSLARRLVGDEPFAVILPDDVIRARQPALAQMVTAFEQSRGHMVATEAVPTEKLSSYGVVDIKSQTGRVQSLKGLVEKPSPARAPSRSGIVGRYILEASIFDWLSSLAPGSGGEIQLTDAIAADLGRTGVNGFAFEGERFDCGSVQGFVQATVAFALDRPDLGAELQNFVTARTAPLQKAA